MPGQRHQLLRIVGRAVRGLHRRAREVHVDRRVPGRHGMAPRDALQRRQPQAGERKGDRAHPEFGIHEHVERIGEYPRRQLRWPPPRAMAEVVGPRREPFRERIHPGQQVVHVHFEVVARQVGHPVLEVAARRRFAEERRDESRPSPARRRARAPAGAAPMRAARVAAAARRPFGEAHLQRPVVAALVREQEVGPAQFVEQPVAGERGGARRRRALDLGKAVRVGGARRRDGARRSPEPSAASATARTARAACAGRARRLPHRRRARRRDRRPRRACPRAAAARSRRAGRAGPPARTPARRRRDRRARAAARRASSARRAGSRRAPARAATPLRRRHRRRRRA